MLQSLHRNQISSMSNATSGMPKSSAYITGEEYNDEESEEDQGEAASRYDVIFGQKGILMLSMLLEFEFATHSVMLVFNVGGVEFVEDRGW